MRRPHEVPGGDEQLLARLGAALAPEETAPEEIAPPVTAVESLRATVARRGSSPAPARERAGLLRRLRGWAHRDHRARRWCVAPHLRTWAGGGGEVGGSTGPEPDRGPAR